MAITDIPLNPPSTTAPIVDSVTFNAETVTWTSTGGSMGSDITGGVIYTDSDIPAEYEHNRILDFTITDNSIVQVKFEVKKEPPKTYLQLPIGKRLISI